jgi:hypothetical protein
MVRCLESKNLTAECAEHSMKRRFASIRRVQCLVLALVLLSYQSCVPAIAPPPLIVVLACPFEIKVLLRKIYAAI